MKNKMIYIILAILTLIGISKIYDIITIQKLRKVNNDLYYDNILISKEVSKLQQKYYIYERLLKKMEQIAGAVKWIDMNVNQFTYTSENCNILLESISRSNKVVYDNYALIKAYRN